MVSIDNLGKLLELPYIPGRKVAIFRVDIGCVQKISIGAAQALCDICGKKEVKSKGSGIRELLNAGLIRENKTGYESTEIALNSDYKDSYDRKEPEIPVASSSGQIFWE